MKGLVRAAEGSTQPEEGAFAEVVADLMQGNLGVAQAVRAFAAVCQNRADQLRCTAAPRPWPAWAQDHAHAMQLCCAQAPALCTLACL